MMICKLINIELLPETVFRQYEPTGVALILKIPQKPFRTQHKHVLEDRAYVNVFASLSYLETFCCTPVKNWFCEISTYIYGMHIVGMYPCDIDDTQI